MGISVPVEKGKTVINPYNERNISNELGKDDFFKLLLTQLQYQDPLSPMDNTDFIAQTAQFTALEQMQNLNQTMTAAQAFNVIGKYVYASSYNASTGKTTDYIGEVEAITIKNGVPYCVIDGTEIPYADVKEVIGSADHTGNISNNVVVSQAMALIGKTVLAIKVDDDLNATEYVEGKVDFVKFVDDTPVLSIGGKEVYLQEVISVADDNLLIGSDVSYPVSVESEEGKEEKIETSKVMDVLIKGDDLFLLLENNKQVKVADINSIITALAFVGQNVSTKEVEGMVEDVVIRGSKPYLVIDGKEVIYTAVIKEAEKTEESKESEESEDTSKDKE